MSIRGASEKQSRGLSYSTADWVREEERASVDRYVGNSAGTQEPSADFTLGVNQGITTDENAWLVANPLHPAVKFDSKNGIVDIKIYKKGLTAAQFEKQLLPFNVYTQSSAVEASFDGLGSDGKTIFLYTGVRVPWPLGLFPTVTKITNYKNESGHIKYEWTLATSAEAKSFFSIPANKAKLTQVMAAKKLKGSADDYITEILEDMDCMKSVKGIQEYDVNTGFYHYKQEVTFTDPVTNTLINKMFGSPSIENAALKVAYNMISEPAYAGKWGQKGLAVKAMPTKSSPQGYTYTADK